MTLKCILMKYLYFKHAMLTKNVSGNTLANDAINLN